jgi:hypothetical protein
LSVKSVFRQKTDERVRKDLKLAAADDGRMERNNKPALIIQQ